MPTSKKSKLLPQARELFAQGLEMQAIADLLKVAPRTLSRWRSKDTVDWRSAKAQRGEWSPEAMRGALRARMAEVIADKTRDVASAADVLWKLQCTVDKISGTVEDPGMVLAVCDKLSRWAVANCDEEQRLVLGRILEGFMADLKLSCGG